MSPTPPPRRPAAALATGLLFLCACSTGGPAGPGGEGEAAGQGQGFGPGIEKAEEVVTKSFAFGATPNVAVEVFLGPIEVTAGTGNSVRATVTKRAGGKTQAEAEAALQEISLTFAEEKGGLRILAKPPKGKSFIGSAEAKLELPSGANLDLATNLAGIRVTGVRGSVRAKSSQGPVVVKDAAGKLDLATSLAKIEVDGPSPEVTAHDSQGAITVRGATGALDLATSLAAITIDAPCTQVTAKNSQGAIKVNGAKGPLRLHTSLAEIHVKADGAEVDAENAQGAVTIEGARGRVRAKTSLAPITIAASDAAVDAQDSQGAVSFRGSLAAGKHQFRTSLAGVTLALPADVSFRLDARASLGQIRNAFPLYQTEQSSSTRVVGTVGDKPDATIFVDVSQGNVTIKKSP